MALDRAVAPLARGDLRRVPSVAPVVPHGRAALAEPRAGATLESGRPVRDHRTGAQYKKFSPNTEFYINWVVANNERLPSRRDRMPYTIFKDKIFEVKVRNTKRKYRDGMIMPECLNYSVIDHLIKRLA